MKANKNICNTPAHVIAFYGNDATRAANVETFAMSQPNYRIALNATNEITTTMRNVRINSAIANHNGAEVTNGN